VRRARIGSLYIQRDSVPPSVWINTNGAFTWLQLGGGAAGGGDSLMMTIVLGRTTVQGDGDEVIAVESDCGQIPFAPESAELLAVGGDAFSTSKGPLGIPFATRVDKDALGIFALSDGTNTWGALSSGAGAEMQLTINVTGATEITLSWLKIGAGVAFRGRLFVWGCLPAVSAAARSFAKPTLRVSGLRMDSGAKAGKSNKSRRK